MVLEERLRCRVNRTLTHRDSRASLLAKENAGNSMPVYALFRMLKRVSRKLSKHAATHRLFDPKVISQGIP